jgi:HEAT repeat protein
MHSQNIVALLRGGDRRSIGRANEVAAIVLRAPKRFSELKKCLWDDDAVVRMRAADAVEKISGKKPELLKRYKAELLGLLVETEQIEVRWHLAAMVPRLPLLEPERRRAVRALELYLEDRSSIVRTAALQGLADLARNDHDLRQRVKVLMEEGLNTGTPAMKARSRRLLREFKDYVGSFVGIPGEIRCNQGERRQRGARNKAF